MQYNTPQFLGVLRYMFQTFFLSEHKMLEMIFGFLWLNDALYSSERILQGDENAARLLGTPLDVIYPVTNTSKNSLQKNIPTRIRFKNYLYEFADDKRSLFTTAKINIKRIVSK